MIKHLADRRASIEVGTVELCFLLALHVRGAAGQLASFSEAQLEEVYEGVSAVVQPEAEGVRRRAGAAIQRLRDQRMLARVDGQGVVRSGEFALSRLATAIVEFFLDDDVLTRESLGALTATLEATLGELAGAARRADGPEAWQRTVTAPLQVTIGELVTAIERRQRGLDLRQEDFQGEIRGLLEADWFGALDRCQALLESTGAALRELNDVLLRDTSRLLALLQDLQDLAAAAGEDDAEAAALRLCDQVDRIAAWGGARQRAWSEYFQHVHRYLRDVVRLDPSRALTQRLREQIAGAAGRAWTLAVAAAPPIRLLRTVTPVRDPAPVARPRAQREKEPAPDTGVDPQAALDDQVRGALAGGAAALSEVTAQIVGEAPEGERFAIAGNVAQRVAGLAKAESERERPWVAVEQMMIEDWAIRARGGGSRE